MNRKLNNEGLWLYQSRMGLMISSRKIDPGIRFFDRLVRIVSLLWLRLIGGILFYSEV
ncbi:MAG: hypothetical protein N2167_00495 [Flavobacteriales bacterium]|nr:hypothetical protein [Flavobacteriales bacterium]